MKKTPVKYSKIIVALVILLNAVFAGATLFVYHDTGSEPTALIAAWFGFTTGELLMLAGIKKRDQDAKKGVEEDEGNG